MGIEVFEREAADQNFETPLSAVESTDGDKPNSISAIVSCSHIKRSLVWPASVRKPSRHRLEASASAAESNGPDRKFLDCWKVACGEHARRAAWIQSAALRGKPG